MTEYTFIDGKNYHVGEMARKIRKGQRIGLSGLGYNIHRELYKFYLQSAYCKACLVDGRLAALWGVIGTLASNRGFVWMTVTEEAMKYPVKMVKETRRQLEIISETYGKLETILLDSDDVAKNFAKFMGFEIGRIGYYVPDGYSGVRFAGNSDGKLAKGGDESFILFGLPRSRTKWLSEFLSYGKWNCHHDLPVYSESLGEILDTLGKPHSGSSETGLVRAYFAIREKYPNIKIVVVLRPWQEVKKSAADIGWNIPDWYLIEEEGYLKKLANMPNVVTVGFDELNYFSGCEAVFSHCLGKKLFPEWFEKFRAQNIQIDMADRFQRLVKNNEKILSIFDEAKNKITVQVEGFEAFFADSEEIIELHKAESWGDEELQSDFNVVMARQYDQSGNLLIVTARIGWKIIGYIVFLIGPSFSTTGILVGYQNAFFVQKEYRGRLGIKIRNLAKEELKKKGADHLILKSGLWGDGPRLKAFYLREGAEFMGEVYRLKLGK